MKGKKLIFVRYFTALAPLCTVRELCCKFNFLVATSFSALQHVVCTAVNRDVYANSLRGGPYLRHSHSDLPPTPFLLSLYLSGSKYPAISMLNVC